MSASLIGGVTTTAPLADDEQISQIQQLALRLPEQLAAELGAISPAEWDASDVQIDYECIEPDARRFIFRVSSRKTPRTNGDTQLIGTGTPAPAGTGAGSGVAAGRHERKFPATLVDMPCVLELLMTHDHADYFKTGDIGQMLVVHEDEAAQEALERLLHRNAAGSDAAGEPSLEQITGSKWTLPSGLTPPTFNIVTENFEAVYSHSASAKDVRAAEQTLEQYRPGAGKRGGKDSEVIEESAEVVALEAWMLSDRDDVSTGKSVAEDDPLVRANPSIMKVAPDARRRVYRPQVRRSQGGNGGRGRGGTMSVGAGAQRRQQQQQQQQQQQKQPTLKLKLGVSKATGQAQTASSSNSTSSDSRVDSELQAEIEALRKLSYQDLQDRFYERKEELDLLDRRAEAEKKKGPVAFNKLKTEREALVAKSKPLFDEIKRRPIDDADGEDEGEYDGDEGDNGTGYENVAGMQEQEQESENELLAMCD